MNCQKSLLLAVSLRFGDGEAMLRLYVRGLPRVSRADSVSWYHFLGLKDTRLEVMLITVEVRVHLLTSARPLDDCWQTGGTVSNSCI